MRLVPVLGVTAAFPACGGDGLIQVLAEALDAVRGDAEGMVPLSDRTLINQMCSADGGLEAQFAADSSGWWSHGKCSGPCAGLETTELWSALGKS